MPADPLTLPEREEIRAGIAAGDSVTRIAAVLGRHRCTISAEVNRNGGRDTYQATGAETQACERRARPKTPKLLADPELAWHVTQRLLALDSPMTISKELANGTHDMVAALLTRRSTRPSTPAVAVASQPKSTGSCIASTGAANAGSPRVRRLVGVHR